MQTVRERTVAYAVSVIRCFRLLPRLPELEIIGRQLLRSATAVGANYREAHRARSNAEFIAKIGDCLKELDETAYWLELLTAVHGDRTPGVVDLIDETNQLLAIFTTISKRVQQRRSRSI